MEENDDFLDDLDENIYLDLIYEKISSKQCVLVLGPNIATVKRKKRDKTHEIIPIHEFIALRKASFLAEKRIDLDTTKRRDLGYIAMLCHSSSYQEVNEDQLGIYVKRVCTQCADRIPPIYQDLAQLPFPLIINTSFDNYMATAIGNRATATFYNYKRVETSTIGEISVENPLVFNLFGSYTNHESLVLSKAQQIDFINKLGRNITKTHSKINSFLNEDTVYLFLGFNTDSWHLPLLFRALNFHKNKAAFYYQFPRAVNIATEHTYRDALKFQMKWELPETFVSNLLSGYNIWKKTKPIKLSKKIIYVDRPEPNQETGKSKILLMTSNPKNAAHLSLNQEIKLIEEELLSAPKGYHFDIKPALDVNKGNISKLLENHKPCVVHFSGHGTGNHLMFYDKGYFDTISGEKLGKVLGFHPSISCVVLNACYSENQAKKIAELIPNVIGTTNTIYDNISIKFAQHFYRALFSGSSYVLAFKKALADLDIQNLEEGAKFVFYKEGKIYDVANEK